MRVPSFEALEAHLELGASWEGFALEQVLRITGDRDACFWATHAGADLDLRVLWLESPPENDGHLPSGPGPGRG